MSEQKFKESKSSLAFSQALIDRMRAEQMPQEEPTMTPEQEMPQEQEMAAPEEVTETTETPETPQEKPEEENGESRLENMFSEFMDTMNKFFKREQEKEPKIELTE